jgi:branched-chain amino acid transport system substrate-binding protein
VRLSLPALVAAALAIALAASGCGSDDGEGAGEIDLVVGNLVPLRGDLAQFGPPARRAGALAATAAEQAAEGGAAVAVRNADTETNDQIAEVLAQQLIEDDGASCLVGDWPTTGTFAVAGNVTVPAGVPLISPASTSAEVSEIGDRDLVSRTAPSDDLQARALARLAARSLGGAAGRTLSVASRDDDYGRRFARILAATWRNLGGAVTGPLLYDPGLLRHREDAAELLAGSPDAYAVIDFPDSFARLAPDLLATQGYDPGRLFLPDVMAVDDVRDADIPPAAVEGARGTLPGVPAPGAGGRIFAEPAGAAPPADFAAHVFDAVTLCFLSAVDADSADPEAIGGRLAAVSGPPGAQYGPDRLPAAVRALRRGEEVDYEGASGPLDLDGEGDPTAGTYGIYTFRGGLRRGGGSFVIRR